ncbi:MAG TPA: RNA polymerase sigma factor [Verrucomicrobiales bacterium]|nr:RNA polymerase sigma factor [Verrucomicrobiales bacterium]
MHDLDFEKLVEDYYTGLYRFALSLSGRTEEACDLTQQTFYRWASKGHQLRDKTKVKSWLFTTLHREFLISKRRQSRFPHVNVDLVEHELPNITPSMVNKVDGGLMMEMLLQVDELYRAPLTLFYCRENSYQEIAEILSIPVGTVMSRLSRGKAQLRRILEVQVAGSSSKIITLNQNYPHKKQTHG